MGKETAPPEAVEALADAGQPFEPEAAAPAIDVNEIVEALTKGLEEGPLVELRARLDSLDTAIVELNQRVEGVEAAREAGDNATLVEQVAELFQHVKLLRTAFSRAINHEVPQVGPAADPEAAEEPAAA